MVRYRKLLAAVSCGGITFGWLQAWGMLNFSEIWTNFLAMLLSVLVSILLGGNVSRYFLGF